MKFDTKQQSSANYICVGFSVMESRSTAKRSAGAFQTTEDIVDGLLLARLAARIDHKDLVEAGLYAADACNLGVASRKPAGA